MASKISTIPPSPLVTGQSTTAALGVSVSLDLPSISNQGFNFADITSGLATFAGWRLQLDKTVEIPFAGSALIDCWVSENVTDKVSGIGFASDAALTDTVTWRVENNGGGYVGTVYVNSNKVAEFPYIRDPQGENGHDFWHVAISNGQFFVYHYQHINHYQKDYVLQGSANVPQTCGWLPLGLKGSGGFDANNSNISRAALQTSNADLNCLTVTPDAYLAVNQTGSGQYSIQTPGQDGRYGLTLSYPGVDNFQYTVVVGAIKFTGDVCGKSFASGSRISLDNNAGMNAQIVLSGGYLLPNANPPVWVLPNVPGSYSAQLIVNGNLAATCEVTVEPQLIIEKVVNGLIESISPLDCVALKANLPNAKFRCINKPESIVPSGMFCPEPETNGFFGEAWYQMEAQAGTQIASFYIHVLPVYPLCPQPALFKPDVPQFYVIKDNGERGCPDRRNLSDAAVHRWTLAYQSLRLRIIDNPKPGSDCFAAYQNIDGSSNDAICKDFSAETLDNFYSMVGGTARPFWFRDDDGRLWRNCYLDEMTRTHEDRESQDRVLKIIWEGCCEDAPQAFDPPLAPLGFR